MDREEDFQSHNNEDLGHSKESSVSRKRKGRGVAMLKKLTKKNDGEKVKVYYNLRGQPVGSTKNDFASYKGLLARTMVPITHKSWHEVPRHLKDNLWTAIQAKFDLNLDTKKDVISDIGVLWKNYKGELTAHYIKPFQEEHDQLKHPPEKYRKFIDQKEWDEFVRVRLSNNFRILSRLQVERRAKNIYNHRLSKKGYAGHVEDLKKKLGESFDEDDRSFVWKTARQNKDGEYRDDATKEVVEKIEALSRRVKDGSLVAQGSSDILKMALGNMEHGGRVRGVGKGVTPTTYFHLSKRGSKKHIRELESRLCAEEEKSKEKDQQIQMLLDQLMKLQKGSLTSPPLSKVASDTQKSDNRKHASTHSESCESPSKRHIGMSKGNWKRQSQIPSSNPTLNNGKGQPCRLALDSINNIVAAGFVFERARPNDKVHHIRLGENNVRVSIDIVYSPNDRLPVPIVNADMLLIKDAHGSHVAWPEDFVLLDMEKEKKQARDDERSAINVFASTLDEIMTTDAITIPVGIFEDDLYTTYVLKSELVRFCKKETLDITCIIAYMRCLYDKFETARGVIKFINPLSIHEALAQKNLNKLIMARLNNAEENQIFVFPFNQGYHWVFVLIEYTSMNVFWIDSLHGTPDPEFKLYITTGLKALIKIKGKRMGPSWECIKGPKQSGNVVCGYYVMWFMRDIMEDPSTPLRLQMKELAGKDTYAIHEINEVQHEFIEYIQEFIN